MRSIHASLLVATLAACSSPSEPTTPPAVVGSIVARDLSISIGGPPSVHVKESPSAACGVVFLVTRSTRILRRAATGRVTSASLSDLIVGRNVAVWADGILKSCPGQASALAVEIIE